MTIPPPGTPTHNLSVMGQGPVSHFTSSTYVEFPPYFPLYERGLPSGNQQGLISSAETISFTPLNNVVVDDAYQAIFVDFSPISFVSETILSLDNSFIAFFLVQNADGTLSFRVTDFGGTAEISGTTVLQNSPRFFTYQVGMIYNRGSASGNLEYFMSLYINGRRETTNVVSSSVASLQFGLREGTMTVTSNGNRIIGHISYSSGHAYTNTEVYSQFQTSSSQYSYQNREGGINNMMTNWQSESIGDPHLIGFNRQRFQFSGENNKFYNLITDNDLQINALFRQLEKGNTTIDKIGIMLLTPTGIEKLEIDCNKKLIYKDKEIDHRFYIKTDDYLVTITPIEDIPVVRQKQFMGKFQWGYRLETYDYIFSFFASKFGYRPPYLNIISELKTQKRRPHGIIGQTATYTTTPQKFLGSQGEGVIEGVYTDYEVDSLWGTDFKYNKFNNKLV